LRSTLKKNKKLPDNIIIYRDGVSTAQRKQVMDFEFKQLRAVIQESNELYDPKICFVIVTKRIGQRFLEAGPDPINPPSGTVIDHGLVEKEEGNYDFFLIPQEVTQGTVQPVHFFVVHDSMKLAKKTLEDFTFSLCYFYFNWAGSIKVPAPCQYAHKLAEYSFKIGMTPHHSLRTKLHFL